uniref:Uncharacterized protein n=1 Tax=Theropithecus gelada TaxID=9565 RepID=A0A8D2EYT0_THEGE
MHAGMGAGTTRMPPGRKGLLVGMLLMRQNAKDFPAQIKDQDTTPSSHNHLGPGRGLCVPHCPIGCSGLCLRELGFGELFISDVLEWPVWQWPLRVGWVPRPIPDTSPAEPSGCSPHQGATEGYAGLGFWCEEGASTSPVVLPAQAQFVGLVAGRWCVGERTVLEAPALWPRSMKGEHTSTQMCRALAWGLCVHRRGTQCVCGPRGPRSCEAYLCVHLCVCTLCVCVHCVCVCIVCVCGHIDVTSQNTVPLRLYSSSDSRALPCPVCVSVWPCA